MQHILRQPIRVTRSTRFHLQFILALCTPLAVHTQTLDPGEQAWHDGQTLALRGQADSALAAYASALDIARRDRDPGLASAARLGMAEVYDVWRRCADSAEVAYREAVRLAEPGDLSATDGFVRWLAAQRRTREARELLQRAYADLDVPRTIKRESIAFLLGEAAIQRASGNGAAALSTLTRAREIADRLAIGDVDSASTNGVNAANYWVLHDLASLRLDARAGAAQNVSMGNRLRADVDGATAVSDAGGVPRFTAARLADRVARARRLCGTGPCDTPPPPTVRRC
jgi:tetratricopeptide (TPR) repeat protein